MHLERVILLLETVSRSDTGMDVSQIHLATGLPKPTCYRLVQDLVTAGLLASNGKGAFTLGTRLLRITNRAHSDQDLFDIVTPLLADAANEFGAALFLSRLRGRGVEIIHAQTPSDEGVSYLHPGLGFRPLHACSCSKAIAAFSDEPHLRNALDNKLKAYTEHTLTDHADLDAELARVREMGFAECIQEIDIGICSVAAPIHTPNLGVTLSLGATGSARKFTKKFRASIAKRLIEISGLVSEKLSLQGTSEQKTSMANR